MLARELGQLGMQRGGERAAGTPLPGMAGWP